MLDIRRIRTDFDAVVAGLARRHDPAIENELRRVLALDERQRAIAAERDELRSKVNAISKEVGTFRRDGKIAEAEARQEESRVLGDSERALAAEYDEIATELRDVLLDVPNIPSDDAPDGGGPDDNVVVKTVGYE